MKNTKGNALITIIIIILIILILAVIGFLSYRFLIVSKQTTNNIAINEEIEISNDILTNNQKENTQIQNNNTKIQNNTQIDAPILNEIQEPTNNIQKETIALRYYYNQLNPYGKMIYDKLKQSKDQFITGTYVFNFGTNFNTLLHSENGQETLNKAFQSAWNAFSYDECDLFYIDITKMNLINETRTLGGITTYYISIGPGDNENYLQDNFQTQESIKKAQKYIDNIIKQIIEQTKNDSDFEKTQKVHDWIIDTIEYDNSLNNINQYNVYGTLHDKKAVCEGYARSFKHIMESIGVPCILISGTAKSSQGTTESHAWNYIQIKQQWYAIDVTWDDPIITGNGTLIDKQKYKFFLKGSEEFFKDHIESGIISENSMIFVLPTLSKIDYKNY